MSCFVTSIMLSMIEVAIDGYILRAETKKAFQSLRAQGTARLAVVQQAIIASSDDDHRLLPTRY